MDKHSDKVQTYLNMITERGYMPLINKPTRVGKKSSTCLDHIMIGPKVTKQMETFILQSSISDHYATILKIYSDKQSATHNSETHITKIEIQYENLINELKNEKWENTLKCENPNDGIKIFTETLTTYIDKNSKIKTKKINKTAKPWITSGIINSMKKRDKLHLLLRKQPFNTQLKEKYKQYRNKLNKVIHSSKTKYLKKEIEETKGDRRKIWGIINEETNYKNKKKGPDKIEIG